MAEHDNSTAAESSRPSPLPSPSPVKVDLFPEAPAPAPPAPSPSKKRKSILIIGNAPGKVVSDPSKFDMVLGFNNLNGFEEIGKIITHHMMRMTLNGGQKYGGEHLALKHGAKLIFADKVACKHVAELEKAWKEGGKEATNFRIRWPGMPYAPGMTPSTGYSVILWYERQDYDVTVERFTFKGTAAHAWDYEREAIEKLAKEGKIKFIEAPQEAPAAPAKPAPAKPVPPVTPDQRPLFNIPPGKNAPAMPAKPAPAPAAKPPDAPAPATPPKVKVAVIGIDGGAIEYGLALASAGYLVSFWEPPLRDQPDTPVAAKGLLRAITTGKAHVAMALSAAVAGASIAVVPAGDAAMEHIRNIMRAATVDITIVAVDRKTAEDCEAMAAAVSEAMSARKSDTIPAGIVFDPVSKGERLDRRTSVAFGAGAADSCSKRHEDVYRQAVKALSPAAAVERIGLGTLAALTEAKEARAEISELVDRRSMELVGARPGVDRKALARLLGTDDAGIAPAAASMGFDVGALRRLVSGLS